MSKSLTSTKPSKSIASYTQEFGRPIAISQLSDTTASTSSEFSDADLITLMNWIGEHMYDDTSVRQQQPSCSICGDGMKVGNLNAAVSFPGQAGQIPCGTLQNMGTVGLIPPAQCAVLSQLISTVCE